MVAGLFVVAVVLAVVVIAVAVVVVGVVVVLVGVIVCSMSSPSDNQVDGLPWVHIIHGT